MTIAQSEIRRSEQLVVKSSARPAPSGGLSAIRHRALLLILIGVALLGGCGRVAGEVGAPEVLEPRAVLPTGAAPSQAGTPTTPGVPAGEVAGYPSAAAGVEVSISCQRGARLDDLPFDRSRVAWLAGVADETPWVISTVTVTNHRSRPVQVGSRFLVSYAAVDGSTIGVAPYREPYRPSLWAAGGQTIVRSSFAFKSLGVPALPIALASDLYDRLGSCHLAAGRVDLVAADPFVDAALSEELEQLSCGLNQPGDRFEATYRIRNEGNTAVVVDLAFEILDEQGNRLGIGGNEGDVVGPGETTEVVGWAAFYTVADIGRADSCRLLTLSSQ